MFTRILLVLVFSASFSTGCSALQLEYGGKFDCQSNYYGINRGSYLNPHNHILELPSLDSRIQMKLDLDFWLGEKLGFYLKDRMGWVVDNDENSLENSLDELYLELNPSESLFLRLGKENIIEGVGYAWNPTDFLTGLGGDNQGEDTREERENREGVICLKGEYFLSDLTLTAIVAPKMEQWGQGADTRALIKIYALMENFDISLTAYAEEKKRAKLGLNFSSTIGESLEVHSEVSLQEGTYHYYVEEIDGGYYEFIQKNRENGQLYPRVLVGGQYTFSDNTNLILEYYHNQEGYNSSEWTDYLEYLKFCGERYEDDSLYVTYLLIGNTYFTLTNLRRNYLFLRFSKSDIRDFFEVSWNNIYNLDDASLLINAKIDYQRMDDFSIYLSGDFFLGDASSEFGMFHQNYTFSAGVEYFF